ncbi:WhiB family transcriptional regulator [Nocardia sp. NPDC046763]|uniref:WhiB family transcriptional regulator n=1 Tax=Nocardia sp. NPDC046763 TaxID=3155256 RepID=UPI0033DDB6F1
MISLQLGACRTSGLSPDAWFAKSSDPDFKRAQGHCLRCPIRRECGDDALDHEAQIGLRAGFRMDRKAQREALRVWLKRPAPASPARSAGPARSAPTVQHAPRTCSCGRAFVPSTRNAERCRPCVQGLVDAEPVQAHLKKLRAHMMLRTVSDRTGLPSSTVRGIANRASRRYVDATAAELILAITPEVP